MVDYVKHFPTNQPPIFLDAQDIVYSEQNRLRGSEGGHRKVSFFSLSMSLLKSSAWA